MENSSVNPILILKDVLLQVDGWLTEGQQLRNLLALNLSKLMSSVKEGPTSDPNFITYQKSPFPAAPKLEKQPSAAQQQQLSSDSKEANEDDNSYDISDDDNESYDADFSDVSDDPDAINDHDHDASVISTYSRVSFPTTVVPVTTTAEVDGKMANDFHLRFKNYQLPNEDSSLQALICHYDESGRFYMTPVELSDQRDNLDLELQDCYYPLVNSALLQLDSPTVGLACVAHDTSDDEEQTPFFYRAQVLELRGPLTLVLAVDYGITKVVPFHQLQHITPNFLKPPKMALHCHASAVVGSFGCEASTFLAACHRSGQLVRAFVIDDNYEIEDGSRVFSLDVFTPDNMDGKLTEDVPDLQTIPNIIKETNEYLFNLEKLLLIPDDSVCTHLKTQERTEVVNWLTGVHQLLKVLVSCNCDQHCPLPDVKTASNVENDGIALPPDVPQSVQSEMNFFVNPKLLDDPNWKIKLQQLVESFDYRQTTCPWAFKLHGCKAINCPYSHTPVL